MVTSSLLRGLEQDKKQELHPTQEETLDGLGPAASDWHAEADFLQV